MSTSNIALEQISQKDIVEIKALANPPETVKQAIVLAFYYICNDKNDEWANVKKTMLGNVGLLNTMKTFDVSKATGV